MNSIKDTKIAVIGLGYVGLPLARLLSTRYETMGFDTNEARIRELNAGRDRTLEVDDELLRQALNSGFTCTAQAGDIKDCNFYIVTVPTPVDGNNTPDMEPLDRASESVGRVLSPGDVVVYESTVYPGVTEQRCVSLLEKASGLKFNRDFFVGFSPERINPGDKCHTVDKIRKVTSGSTPEAAEYIDRVYASVITAGTYLAPSIMVAEAAKVIENSQRDINIAFVNELAKIFSRLGIDTGDVLEAAATKWNFLPFKPGLVGGHCIGVDPYYLAQCAQENRYYPEIILAGRRLNDGMGEHVAKELVKLMLRKEVPVLGAEVLVMGFTFKENCPDVRNTKVIDIIESLGEFDARVTVYDPLADAAQAERIYGVQPVKEFPDKKYDVIVLAVGHDAFRDVDVTQRIKDKSVVYDVKGFLDRSIVDGRL